MHPYKRVVILGGPGTGKSTLGPRLAPILDLPFTDLDDLWWDTGWTNPSEAEYREREDRLFAQPSWLIAHDVWPDNMPAADLVIYIDLSSALCVRRVFKRSFDQRFRGKVDLLPVNCREGGGIEPLKYTFDLLRYTWSFRSKVPGYFAELCSKGVEEMVPLSSAADIDGFRRELEVGVVEEVVGRWLRPVPTAPSS